MNPKVAIIGTRGYPSYYGGFETAVRKLAPFLDSNGWDVTVYGRPGATNLAEAQAHPGIHSVFTWGLESRSLSTLSFGLSATLDAWRRKPDVVLVMNVANGFYLPILRLRGIRTVVNVDGIEWDREKWGRLAKLVFRVGARLTAKFADELVFDAHEIALRWRKEFGRIGTYIPYGGEKAGELPIEPGLEHRGYVLVVARFVPENSIPEFFDAVETISRDSKVIIVGSSGYGGELDERASALGTLPNVRWLGHVSDDARLLSLWQHAGVYFHGHSVGGTNPTLVQAMAVGAPVVARDTVYNREVLGEEGVFCSPIAADISESVLRLLKDRTTQKRMSSAYISRAETFFDWAKVNSAYQDLLELDSGQV